MFCFSSFVGPYLLFVIYIFLISHLVIVAVPGFFAGLGFTQFSGEYMIQLFNKFSIDVPILAIGLCELVFIPWVYGMNRFVDM